MREEPVSQIALSEKVGVDILKLLNVSVHNLIRATITIEVNTILTVDCLYQGEINEDRTGFEEISKRYELTVNEIEYQL